MYSICGNKFAFQNVDFLSDQTINISGVTHMPALTYTLVAHTCTVKYTTEKNIVKCILSKFINILIGEHHSYEPTPYPYTVLSYCVTNISVDTKFRFRVADVLPIRST